LDPVTDPAAPKQVTLIIFCSPFLYFDYAQGSIALFRINVNGYEMRGS